MKFSTQMLCAEDDSAIALAASLLKAGEIVAIPTETVYGLAADATNAQAVQKIFEAKGRPQDNPLIVHVSSLDMWASLVLSLPPDAVTLANAFWPGPLTIILPKSDRLPAETTAGLDSVAVRMPSHPAALALIKAAGMPLAAPSANLSGSPSPTTAAHCADDLWGSIPLILNGGSCDVGIESTVLSLVGEPMVLRPGKITSDELAQVLHKPVGIAASVDSPLKEGETASSPGMKYRHYSPTAKLILLKGSLESYLNYLERSPEDTFGLVFKGEEQLTNHPCVSYGAQHDPQQQAQRLFAALRTLDEQGATLVYVRCPDHDNAALGVYNRILRAAAFEVKTI